MIFRVDIPGNEFLLLHSFFNFFPHILISDIGQKDLTDRLMRDGTDFQHQPCDKQGVKGFIRQQLFMAQKGFYRILTAYLSYFKPAQREIKQRGNELWFLSQDLLPKLNRGFPGTDKQRSFICFICVFRTGERRIPHFIKIQTLVITLHSHISFTALRAMHKIFSSDSHTQAGGPYPVHVKNDKYKFPCHQDEKKYSSHHE